MSTSAQSHDRFAFAMPAIHATLVTLLLFLFTWPAATAEPRDVPLGVVGPAPATDQISSMLEERQPGAFDVSIFASPDEAAEAIQTREIYGAIVVGQAVEVQVASAANPAVAQLITSLGDNLMAGNLAQQGIQVPTVTVTELAPLPEADVRGVILGSASLPVVIGGIALGALVSLRVRGAWTQLSVVGASALLSGSALAWGMGPGLGALSGDYWTNAITLAAILGAFGFPLVAAHRLAGLGGFGLVAATFFLLGNPLSGISLPPEFYPSVWGEIGQLMPLGAGFDLLKSLNFFESASTQAPLWVLGTWILAALALWFIPTRKGRETITAA